LRTRSDGLRQFVVPFGTFDEPDVTHFREFGAGILRRAQHHVAVSAFDKHVGDGFGKELSLRDREQMLLASRSGILDQRNVVEQTRSLENRAGDVDLIVERQLADHVRWRIRDRREPIGERGARRKFNIGNEVIEHTIEHLNMIAGKMARSKDEKIGNAAECFRPPFG
jgi:hypothetical protein